MGLLVFARVAWKSIHDSRLHVEVLKIANGPTGPYHFHCSVHSWDILFVSERNNTFIPEFLLVMQRSGRCGSFV